jgi:hypothetical protein
MPSDVELTLLNRVVVAGYKLPTNWRGEYFVPKGFSVVDSGQSPHEFVLLAWEDGSWAVMTNVASLDAGDTRGEQGLGKRLEEALDEYVAKGLVESGWRQCAEICVSSVCNGLASVAEGLDTAQARWHDVLGEPVQHVSEAIGVDPVLSNVLGGIAREVALPGDTLIKDMKRAVQYSGLAIGAFSGNYILVNFFLKSLIHDLAVEKVTKEVGRVLRGDG